MIKYQKTNETSRDSPQSVQLIKWCTEKSSFLGIIIQFAVFYHKSKDCMALANSLITMLGRFQ